MMASLFHPTLKFFSHLKNIHIQTARTVSALHIPGNKAKGAVSLLKPSLDHIDKLLDEKQILKQNLEMRGCSLNLDLFEESWRRMQELRRQRDWLEEQRDRVSHQIREHVTQKNEHNRSAIEELKKEGKRLRNQLKELSESWWALEEEAVLSALKLPNLLHRKTPELDEIIGCHRSPPEGQATSHKKCEEIEFLDHSPTAYYLKGSLAYKELELARNFSRRLFDEGFHLISAPDFVKSLVVEGCGLDFSDANRVLALAEAHDTDADGADALHLVGGASLPSLVAFLTKNVIQSPLPLRLAAGGRSYRPARSSDGLFGAVQSTGVHFVSVLENCPDRLYEEVERLRDVLTDLLAEHLGVHFRICAVSSRHLETWEQYRASFQIYLPTTKRYVQVASVSIVGDFISRRLAIYGPDGQHPGFVSGTALCTSDVLAAWTEYQSIDEKNDS